MNNPHAAVTTPAVPASPFHPGEQAVQDIAGVRDEAEQRGLKMLTPQLVDAQRAFFAQLSFAVSSQLDDKGQPWAGLLTGQPGFIQAAPDGRVAIERGGTAAPGATALDALFPVPRPGAAIGLLGIEFARRRRNRINGTVVAAGEQGIELQIDQGYGNCPKYINKRELKDGLFTGDYMPTRYHSITAYVARLLAHADTFFIASSSGPQQQAETIQPQAWGSDISHRGGEPGFLQVDGNTLSFDDYPGNNLFNTLGNLKAYPLCGLLVPDFESGEIVQIAGRAELTHNGEHYRTAIAVHEVRCLTKVRES